MVNGYARLPGANDDNDDVVSVTSYYDGPEKEHLADSRRSLESEGESAYESVSEEDVDGGEFARARGARPRPRGERAARRSSSHSPRRTAADENRDPARGDSLRQGRYPVQSDSVHRRRSSPPRSWGPCKYAAHPFYDAATGRIVGTFDGPPSDGRPMPPPTQRSPAWPGAMAGPGYQQRPPVQTQGGANANGSGPFVDFSSLPPPNAILPLRSQPPQFFPANAPMPPMPSNWPPMSQQPPASHHQQPPTQQKPPVKILPDGRLAMLPSPPMTATVHSAGPSPPPSSASTTPTVIPAPNTPPEHAARPPSPPKKIDYRLIIRTSQVSPWGGPAASSQAAASVSYRILAHGPPTRCEMRALALKYVRADPEAFRRAGLHVSAQPSPADPPVRAVVTRAMFAAGPHGAEESYDLAAYGEDDFGRLCESMAAAGAAREGGHRATPLFEVVVSNI